MSGAGTPTFELDGHGLNIVVIAGSWHETITNGLIAGTVETLNRAGATFSVLRVPGSFELPVAAKAAMEAGADAVVALGVIIRGGTPHFDYVANAATDGLTRVALDTGKPVGFGVLTLENEEQGLDRAGLPGSRENKGAEAAEAALATARILETLRGDISHRETR